MIRILLSTLRTAMSCRPQQGLGTASVLFALEEAHQFSGGKSVRDGIYSVLAGRLNPDQFIESGRCRVTLTPT
ncbi:MAG TPA: hypothetical protein V6C78_19175 [Crinalium sp.]